jgi:hypothetical protein
LRCSQEEVSSYPGKEELEAKIKEFIPTAETFEKVEKIKDEDGFESL